MQLAPRDPFLNFGAPSYWNG